MKNCSKLKPDVLSAKHIKFKKKEKLIIPVDEIISVISHLGSKVNELDQDGQWRSENSLWAQLATELAEKLSILNTIGVRKYIYTAWHRKSSNIRSQFINESVHDDMTSNLPELASIPSVNKICTRSKKLNSSSTNALTREKREYLIEFTYEEWRQIYKKDKTSPDFHSMDPSWTDVFNEKLLDSKVTTCSIVFTKSTLRKKISRKRNKALFNCHGRCQDHNCPIKVYMVIAQPILPGHNVVFRVVVTGIPINHANSSTTFARPLKGARRVQMAKKAIEQGILQTYEENLQNADDHLLQKKNYTQVPPIDVIKTAVKEQRNTMQIDPDILSALTTLLLSMIATDEKSNIQNKGYIQVLQIWPFAVIFYTEAQLCRFAEYCLSTKDSCIYIDATGSVVTGLPDQKKPFLYLICYKNGQDPSNLLPLSGALLTDHTAASITNWLLIVRRGIAAAKRRFIRPSFIVIDFSPALLNAILLAINHTNINSYLRWCFNVIQKKYTSDQLRSMSCVRFCCAHVMHAFTRSLSKIKIHKDIRKKITMAFGLLLNCNDFNQIYDIIGCLVCIFGSPDLDNAEEFLNEVLKAGGECNVDFQSFFEDQDVSNGQRLVEEQLAELDDNFLSTQPIIHQSPFTLLARERSPVLSTLLNQTKNPDKTAIKNQLFSKELVKLFYKWIAYLPVFSGLMYRFQERYGVDSICDTESRIFGAGRLSNAPVESFFKILKHSILRHKTNWRPDDFLLKMYATTNARLKANEHNINQSGSKKQKRSMKKPVDTTTDIENWRNQGTAIADRGVYFTKFKEIKLTANEVRSRLREKLEMRTNCSRNHDDDENFPFVSTTDDDFLSMVEIEQDLEVIQELKQNSESTSCHDHHQKQFIDVIDEQPIESTTTLQTNNNINQSIEATSKTRNDKNDNDGIIEFYLPKNWPTHTMVGNLKLPFPHFNIGPTFFDGKRYSASNTCTLDSSLFLLYYIYKSNSDDFRSLFDQNILAWEQLRKTFNLVDTKGWDIARLYWISIHSTHSNSNEITQHFNLYGTADENVFQYVRELQKHTIKSKCTSPDCPTSIRVRHSVDISMPTLTGRNRRLVNLTIFSQKWTTKCGAAIGPNEPTSYNGSYSQDNFFPTKDGNCIGTMFICGSDRIHQPNEFVYKSPPILLINVGQVKPDDDDKDRLTFLTVKELPFVLLVGKERYHLVGALCPSPGHFTATIVRDKNIFSKYDDLCKLGVQDNQDGDDIVETAVYSIQMKKD